MSKRNRIKNNSSSRKTPLKKPQLTLSSYDPVLIEVPFVEVSAEDVEEQMRSTAAKFPTFSPVANRAVQPQDLLLISMSSTTAGIPLERLTYQRQRISLADENIPDGLKKKLLEMSPGETQTVEYLAETGSDDGEGNLLTTMVSSTITIHEIQEETVSEITDEWVATFIPGATTVEEFRSRVRQQMEGKANAYYEEMKYSKCAAALAERLEGSIPDELFEQGLNAARKDFETMLLQQRLTKEEYMQRTGTSEEQLSMQFMMRGRQLIAEGMALEAFAYHLGLEVTSEDIDAVFGREVSPQQAENMRESFEKAGKLDELQRMAACGKALDYAVAHARITRKKLQGSLNPFS